MTVRPIQHDDIIGQDLCEQRYRVLSQLGEGSMAWVYKAYDSRLETNVVLKVPKSEKIGDREFLNRFHRESQLMVRLTHPHVVSILDVGEHQGIPLVVMHYLSGGTLKDLIVAAKSANKLLDVTSLKSWIREVARALDFVHSQNVVHRDVKPANILFDEHKNAFVSDFGLTKVFHGDHRDLDSESTAAGFVIGTPNYVAPEIVLGNDYDGRADQYSLGITIYHALTGSPPMQGASSSATMVNQAQKKLPLLSDIRPDVPEELAQAVNRAIQKKPNLRFESCEALADAVLLAIAQQGSGSSVSKLAPARSGSSQQMKRPKRSKKKRPKKKPSGGPGAASGQYDPYGVGDNYGSDLDDEYDLQNMELPPRSSGGRSSDVSKGKPGLVKCPACGEMLPLKPMHAGRTGRCIHCNVRLTVSKDLTILRRIRGDAKKNKGPGDSSKEMILGEKVFGWEIPKNAAIWIASILVVVLIISTVVVTVNLTGPDPDDIKQEETQEVGRSMEG